MISGLKKIASALVIGIISSGLWLLVDALCGHRLILHIYHFDLSSIDHRLQPNNPSIPTNNDGIKDTRARAAFGEENFNIIFLGDSFVYNSVENGISIPTLLEKQLNEALQTQRIHVANFAWPSSSPFLSLRLLRDLGEKYHPDLVILGFDMTDFQDDIKYQLWVQRAPVVSRVVSSFPMTMTLLSNLDDTILPRLLSLSTKIHGLPIYGFQKSKFFWLTLPQDESVQLFSYVKDSLDKINDLSQQLGAKFVLFVFPRNFQYNRSESPTYKRRDRYEFTSKTVLLPFEYFANLASHVNYPIVSLLETFQQTDIFPTCFDDDPHWNRNGMELASAAIAEWLRVHAISQASVLQQLRQ